VTAVDGSDVEEANSRLALGLKSCRAVVRNYRSLLETDMASDSTATMPNYDDRADPAKLAGPPGET
jgi:hypothetical protein